MASYNLGSFGYGAKCGASEPPLCSNQHYSGKTYCYIIVSSLRTYHLIQTFEYYFATRLAIEHALSVANARRVKQLFRVLFLFSPGHTSGRSCRQFLPSLLFTSFPPPSLLAHCLTRSNFMEQRKAKWRRIDLADTHSQQLALKP